MANLSGQTIQSTYPGLLNLNVATTGITSTPQAITDGFGNNTGSQISTNYFYNPSLFGVKAIIPDNSGVGFNSSAVTPPTGNTNNNVYFFPFYDTGYLSYSAITTLITNATSSSDVMNMYIYNSQYLSGTGYGLQPYQQIYSGTTLPTTGTANVPRTTALTGNISFSGYGPGIYYMAVNITNAGVSPTVRYGGSPGNQNSIFTTLAAFYGSTQATTTVLLGNSVSKGGGALPITLNGGVAASYSSSDIIARWITSATTATAMGFVFNTVK
jgi:hypothetical protein